MLAKTLKECKEFLAGDHTMLRELLRPDSAVNVRYSLAHGRLEPGRRSKRHRLASTEVYYFLSGEGVLTTGEESVRVEAGSLVYVPARAMQFLTNCGPDPIEFLCLVDPAWTREDEEVLESGDLGES